MVKSDSKTVKWEIKNWVHLHDVIAASQEGCIVEIPNQVSLRFFLQPFEKHWNDPSGGIHANWQGYSLCARFLQCSNTIAAIKVNAGVSLIPTVSKNLTQGYPTYPVVPAGNYLAIKKYITCYLLT